MLRRYGPMDTAELERLLEDDVFLCPACRRWFKVGDYTALVCIGPGEDPDERAKAAAGQVYNAVALRVHYACATGVTEPPDEVKVPV